MTDTPEVAIIGAGPYGLSLAAHLTAMGVEHRIFGLPMHAWRTQMPKGMFLKSDGFGSNLSDREQSFSLKDCCTEAGIAYADEGKPISLELFCAYGIAFQERFVRHLEPTLVSRVNVDSDGALTLQLEDGQLVRPRKVVLAVGIGHFQRIPEALASLPAEFCSHSAACTEPARFADRDVVVVGAGASALDVAALLHASGARVHLVARKPAVQFHAGPSGKPRTLWQRLTQPKSGLGPSLRSLLYAEAPLLFHYFPERTRLRIARNYLGPAGGWFMRDQVLGKFPMLLGQTVKTARVIDGRVQLQLTGDDGATSTIEADHVIAATGYEVDLKRLKFLDPALLARVHMVNSTPVLSSHFETSLPGLHVVGAAAANSFGPVMRFTFGARFVARRLSAYLRRGAQRSSYLGRLLQSAAAFQWRAVFLQLATSLEWRLSPRHDVMRAVMRENGSFDAQNGTDTRGEIPLERLGIDPVEAQHGNGVYRAVPASHFRAALSLLDLPLEHYAFVDYGSGKGKALLLACDYPFRKIVGIEYARPLHEAACSNIALYPAAAYRGRVSSQHADARNHEPPAGPLVCFFFNPFDAATWRLVLTRLRASFEAAPRPIHIVYVNVRDVDELENVFPEFRIFAPGPRTKTIRILSAIPAKAARAPRTPVADTVAL